MQKDRTARRAMALHPRDNVAQVSASVSTPDRTVLERFPAGAPRGSWPAEEYAAARRNEGIPATVVMDIRTDEYVVKAVTL